MRAQAVRVLLALALAALAWAMALPAAAGPPAPRAVAGALALAGWDFQRDGVLPLDGEWRFAPGRLIGPRQPWPADALLTRVPSAWNDHFPNGWGVGTYALEVRCSGAPPLALLLPFQHTAVTLYVNGRLLVRQGRAGTRDGGHAPSVDHLLVPLAGVRCPLQLTVQVSNFDLPRGGLVRSMRLGTPEQLAERRARTVLPSVLALGGVAVVGVFALMFALWRPRELSSWMFPVFCLSFALNLALAGERVLQPWLGWFGFEAQQRWLYASWFLGLASGPLMLRGFYPRQTPRLPVLFVAGFAAAGLVLTALAPLPAIGRFATLLQFAGAGAGAFLLWCLGRALRAGERDAGIMLLALGGLLATVAHDVAFFARPADTSLLPFGVLVFVLGLALMQGRRLARALSREEMRLIEQRGRTDLLVRATNAGLLDWDAVEGRVSYSERYKEMLGYPAEAADDTLPPFRELVHPDDRGAVVARFMEQLRTREVLGGVQHHEPWVFRMRRQDGGELWVQAEGISIRDRGGRTLRFVCSLLDVSARMRHEQEMGDRIQFIHHLFDSVPLALALRDTQGRYLAVNRTWEREEGLVRATVLGRSPADLGQADAEAMLAMDRAALARPPGQASAPSEIDSNGRHLLQTRTVMNDPQGEPMGVLVASVDISEKHQMERALAMERERLALLVRATKAGFSDWDAASNHTVYNARLKEMLGWPADYDTRNWPPLYDMMLPEDATRVRRLLRELVRQPGAAGEYRLGAPLTYRLRRRDGRFIWVQAEGLAEIGDDGRCRRVITSYLDVTDLREQAEALRRSRDEIADRMKFINDLVDAMPLAVSMRDPQGRFVFANRTWERFYGQPRDEVIGRHVRETFPAEVATEVEALDRAALQRGVDNPATVDTRYGGRDFTQTRNVLANARGEPVGVVVATQDVTERRAMERALATEQRRFELVVRAAQVGILDWDGVQNRLWYSPRLREMLGHPPDADTSGWPDYFSLVHPQDRERLRAGFRAYLAKQRQPGELNSFGRIEYRLQRADGSWIWVEGIGVSQTDAQGRTAQFISSVTDITERRAQQEALQASRDQIAAQAQLLERQNEALKENVRLREEVERIGRHDLKTPLASIVAVPRLLRENRTLGPEADELLGLVERAGYRILSMVNLSLDLYKMEQGSYQLRPQPVDLADLVRKLMADLHLHAASKQVELRLEIGGEGCHAWGEELLCYSLLANLLKNAVEASPEGQPVTVRIDTDAGGMLVLRIHNAGTIPAAMRNRFFSKYATAGKAGGTGLGSYSARLMARVQNGEVEMDSAAERGTTLTVRLPLAPAGQLPPAPGVAGPAAAQPAELEGLPPLRVLLVDDDEYNLLIVRRLLPVPPLQVRTAVNGRAALALAGEDWPDLLLMDLDMPVMGGLEAVARLRELERSRGLARCQMVALSSHDDEATQQRALAAGFDHYLTKPLTREALQQLLAERHAGLRELVLDPQLGPLLPGFLESRQALLAELAAAVERQDREELRRLAHQLAGSFALYQLSWASDRSRWLERHAGDVPLDQARRRVADLQQHLQEVSERLRHEQA